jgi:hypothetical protein
VGVREAVYDLIRTRGGVSFVEVGKITPPTEASGDLVTMWAAPNCMLWESLPRATAEAILELEREDRIRIKSAALLVYLIDGETIRLPIAKRVRPYKAPHWIPTTLWATNDPRLPEVLRKRRKASDESPRVFRSEV